MSLVVPAVLPSSRADLEEKLGRFLQVPGVTRIQIDAVDGRFATPASWPYTEVGALHAAAEEMTLLPHQDRVSYEIDLMCLDAERAAGDWLALGASRLTFHAASVLDLKRFFDSVGQRYGRDVISFGLALNLTTDPTLVEPVAEDISYIQCMGIDTIGRQGQPFDPRVVERIKTLRNRYPKLPIQVDGGVSLATARTLIEAGVHNLIVGSALLNAPDLEAEFNSFEALETPYAA